MLFVKDSVWVRLPHRQPGCWPRGASGDWILSSWVGIRDSKCGCGAGSFIVSVQPALLHTAHCSEGSRAGSLVFSIAILKFLIILFLNLCFISEVRETVEHDQGLAVSAHKQSCFLPPPAPSFSAASTSSSHWHPSPWLGPRSEAGRFGARSAHACWVVGLGLIHSSSTPEHKGLQHQIANRKHHDKLKETQNLENAFSSAF